MLGDATDYKFKLPLLGAGQSNPTDNNNSNNNSNNHNNNNNSESLFSMDKFRESFAKAAGAVGLETKASQDSSTSIATEDSATAMEELSEFCPKLTFKQVRTTLTSSMHIHIHFIRTYTLLLHICITNGTHFICLIFHTLQISHHSQRLIGFVICYAAGYMITFSSFHYFVRVVEGHPMPFVVSYTFGNVLSLLSSMFLCGPNRQYK